MRISLFIITFIALLGSLVVIALQNKNSGIQPLENNIINTTLSEAKRVTTITPNTEVEKERNTEQTLSASLIIDLRNQNLTKAPSYIFEKTNIQKLDLSHNNLNGALQAEIRHLSALRILDLSDNQFTGIPAEIGQLKNLEILDISNNELTGLPYELGNLSNLKILDIRGNAYAIADLEIIKKHLPSTTEIITN